MDRDEIDDIEVFKAAYVQDKNWFFELVAAYTILFKSKYVICSFVFRNRFVMPSKALVKNVQRKRNVKSSSTTRLTRSKPT